MALQLYKSDGGADLSRLWGFLSIGLIAGLLLVALNQSISYYMPCFGCFKFGVVLFHLLILTGILIAAGNAAKNRSPAVHYLVSIGICAVLYLAQWAVFINLWLDEYKPPGAPAGVLLDSTQLYNWFVYIANNDSLQMGSRDSGSDTVSGWILWGLWTAEAAIAVLAPPLLSTDYMDEPFYPQVNEWGVKRRLPNRYAAPAGAPTTEQVLADDSFDWLKDLYKFEGAGCLTIEIIEHKDQPVSYFNVFSVVVETDSNKKSTVKTVPIVKFVELGAKQRAIFDGLIQDANNREAPDTAAADKIDEDDAAEASDVDEVEDLDADEADDGETEDASATDRDLRAADNAAADPDPDLAELIRLEREEAAAAKNPYSTAPTPSDRATKPKPPPPPPPADPAPGKSVDDLWDE